MAMQQDYILIKGARENNLKNVSLEIPKRKITVFTGVSGSGKSSIVFDTIAAEAQRQLNETFTMFVRNFLPHYGQPEADSIENLSTAIIINQKRIGGNSRSTVGTITDIFSLIRLLYSRVGQPYVGYSNAFSFNDPTGMCPECDGVGRKVEVDVDKLFDKSKSLNEGAILLPNYGVDSWYWKIYVNSGLFDNDKKLADYTKTEWQNLLHGDDSLVKKKPTKGMEINIKYEGIVDKFARSYIKRDTSSASEATLEKVERFVTSVTCPLCKGARLSPRALSAKIDGWNIAELAALEAVELAQVVRSFKGKVAESLVADIASRLDQLVDIGLGYLTLDRETATLSGGESQRIKMVRHLSSSLTDVMYVFDEPSIGLHPHDVHRLNELLKKLCDKGNTVLVVEHDPDVISIADHIVDVGPKAGVHGGEIVYEGDAAGLMRADTLTGQFLTHRRPLKADYREPTGQMKINKATLHNLKNVSVSIPVGVLTVVTGVAGSGKSTLINEIFVEQHPEAIVIDQSAVGTSSRSNTATYTGLMDDIRQLFAKANKVNASLFSFNSKGACPNCQGLGVIYTELAFLDPIKTTCEICNGKRFNAEVLAYELRGKSISDVLHLTAAEALEFFTEKELRKRLEAINAVGLDYLTLGQPLSTLSGGECQRIKLASELHKEGSVYVMDEPTTGLHLSDVGRLLKVIDTLVDGGNTVVVIEHNLEVIKNADWIIDMGPEGGTKGGQVIFEGTPKELLKAKNSLTGESLRKNV